MIGTGYALPRLCRNAPSCLIISLKATPPTRVLPTNASGVVWLSRSLAWLDVNAMSLKHFGQFASFVHFTNDVTTANKFAFYIKLWDRWPV